MNYRGKKAQTLAEYAVLIALVVTAIVAMRTYMVRSLQGRLRDAAQNFVSQTNGTTTQYEPYYLESSYDVTSRERQREVYAVGGGVTRTTAEGDEETRRAAGGYQVIRGEERED